MSDLRESAPTDTSRPVPGPRRPRQIWTGRSEVWLSEVSADPAEPMRSIAGGGLRRSNRMLDDVLERDRRRKRARSIGVDAARGFALIGMFAVHMLPAAHDDGTPTASWTLFAGNAASLFAVLAGVSLSFGSGGDSPAMGKAMNRSRVNIAVRGIILLLIGLAINAWGLGAFDILPYFAVMFLLGIPLLPLRARSLFTIGTVMVLLCPVLRYLLHRQAVDLPRVPNPTALTLVENPLGFLPTLTVTGVYPAMTWIGLVCLGMGLGRLRLHHSNPRMVLIVAGATVMLLTYVLNFLLVIRLGGYERVREAFPGRSADAVDDFIVYGPTGPLPTESPWWLLTAGPHANTTFSMAIGAGFAFIAIGLFIALARWTAPIRFLVDLGRMPMTIYILHLVTLAPLSAVMGEIPLFLTEAAAALVVSAIWMRIAKRGPVEGFTTAVTRAVTSVLGLRAEQTSSSVSRHDFRSKR